MMTTPTSNFNDDSLFGDVCIAYVGSQVDHVCALEVVVGR
jgi:hypothetical protein